MSHIQQNPAAERAILAGICRYGSEAFYEVSDILTEKSFTIDSNQFIYRCLRHILESDGNAKVDLPSIFAAGTTLGISFFLEKKHELEHLKGIMAFPADLKNIRRFAGIVAKLEVARQLDHQLTIAKERLTEVTGEESVSQIRGVVEDCILNFSSLLEDEGGPILLGKDIKDFIDHKAENPVDNVGISTGFPLYDQAIGGGLVGGTLHMIAARVKVGKSWWCANMGSHIAAQNIPVLYMDSEMNADMQKGRLISLTSGVALNDVNTGKFSLDVDKNRKVYDAGEKLGDIPLWYQNMAGMSMESQLSSMRRWLCKNVKLQADGTAATPCVIFYDYVKLMDDSLLKKSMVEHQAIGFIMTSLHNFASKYNVAMVGLAQLNRDGIGDKNDGSVIAQSDRILWLCDSAGLIRPKSCEEEMMDGPKNGNRKLIVMCARSGPGTENGDYINIHFKGWCGEMKEGRLHSDLTLNKNSGEIVDSGFEQTEGGGEEYDLPFDPM